MQIDRTEIERANEYEYLEQTIAMENQTQKDVSIRIKAEWSGFFRKHKEILLDRYLPISQQRKAFSQCFSSATAYRWQTWFVTMAGTFETSQRGTESKILNIKLQERIRYTTTRQRSWVTDMVEMSQKRKWIRHIAWMNDSRWTKRSTEWQVNSVRPVGRPTHRWRDDTVVHQGAAWTRTAKY